MIVDKLYYLASLPQSFSLYFVTLISNVEFPTHLDDFRPISLVSFIYKLLAKVLVIRLFVVIDNIIFHNQLIFLKRMLLVDGMVVVNELVDMIKKKTCFNFKVDFEKKCIIQLVEAFLNYMLIKFDFNIKV